MEKALPYDGLQHLGDGGGKGDGAEAIFVGGLLGLVDGDDDG